MSLDLTGDFGAALGADPARLHLAAHSHHPWPDVTRAAQIQAWDDAMAGLDHKWERVFADIVPAVQRGIADILSLPDPATIAFAPNTHEFVKRLLSCLAPGRPPRVLTTDGEFHSFARQAARLEEDGLIQVARIPAEPFDTVEARLIDAAAQGGWDMVFLSQVFFNSAAVCGDPGRLVGAVPDEETLIVIDGYHGFMALPTDLSALADRAFYLSGGYKYAMAGEGVCFLHCPPAYGPRPRDTGWFAAFGALSDTRDGVAYGPGGARFMGATFDPSGLYRQRAVFDWMAARGLTVAAIHAHALACQEAFHRALAAYGIDGLTDAALITPLDRAARGHFLTYRSARAGALHAALTRAGIVTDRRGDRLRFGFGIYHRLADMADAAARVAAVAR